MPTLTTGRPRCRKGRVRHALCGSGQVVRVRVQVRVWVWVWVFKVRDKATPSLGEGGEFVHLVKAVGLGGSKNQGTRPKALEKPGRGPGRGTKGYSVACGRGKAVGAFMKTKHTLSPRYTIRLYTPPTLFRGGQNMGHKRRQFESAQLTRPPGYFTQANDARAA